MDLRNARFCVGAVAATLLLISAPASAQQLFFDDFNSDTRAGNVTSLLQWTVPAGNVDVIGPTFFDFYPGNGNYLDMDGSGGVAGTIQTRTLFDLAAGDYTLSFDQGKNGGAAESMNISVGSVFTQLFSSPAGSVPTLINRQFNFTVGAPTTGRIVFAHQGGDNAGLVVDNVRLVRVVTVPEPSALVLLLPMVGLIALAKTRRNKN